MIRGLLCLNSAELIGGRLVVLQPASVFYCPVQVNLLLPAQELQPSVGKVVQVRLNAENGASHRTARLGRFSRVPVGSRRELFGPVEVRAEHLQRGNWNEVREAIEGLRLRVRD